MSDDFTPILDGFVWSVGALCRAVADALQARFNPVVVRGELSGFSRATSGHCYFSLKDASGQLRCAMFKRAAVLMTVVPRDGELVEVRGRLGVYEPRGDLQLIVDSLCRCGQGHLFDEFLQRKARLEAQGLLDAARKRPLPKRPRAIGVVTSLGAAALHDVVSVLQRRVPHIPVLLAAASVQGNSAPCELVDALLKLYLLTQTGVALEADLMPKSRRTKTHHAPIDVILLVRGGGSLEDLWAFNDEALARVIAQSPVPIVSGVGHETDFTIADFVADVRAPTPTAAAELAAASPRQNELDLLALAERHITVAIERQLQRHAQRLDDVAQRLGRPSHRLMVQRMRLAVSAKALQTSCTHALQAQAQRLRRIADQLPLALNAGVQIHKQRLDRAALRLSLLDPSLVLARGYAWLSDAQGHTVSSCLQTHTGQVLTATLGDGTVDMTVNGSSLMATPPGFSGLPT